MGGEGTRKGFPGDLVLDAGALIAFERGDERVRGLLKTALALKSRIVVPASALAQAWRGGPAAAPLARVLDSSHLDALEGRRAKEVGVRLGERGQRDAIDAHAVCCAVECGAAIATSGLDDVAGLIGPGERVTTIVV